MPKTTKTTPKQTKNQKLTYRNAISLIFKEAGEFLPNKDADVIRVMEYVVQLNEAGIIQNLNEELTDEQFQRLYDVIERLKNNEPLEYITEVADFYGYRFRANRSTLIPRIETETLTGLAIEKIRESFYGKQKGQKVNVVDVGTGTGNIIISIAKTLHEDVNLWAVEISPEAFNVAQENIEAHELTDKIKLVEGNLLDPIPEGVKFDVIVANLPYVYRSDIPNLPESVQKFEPHVALDGGMNGSSLIRDLIAESVDRLNPGGTILLELQEREIDRIKTEVKRYLPNAKIQIESSPSEGQTRFVIIQTKR